MDYKADLTKRMKEAIEAVKASLPQAEPKLTTHGPSLSRRHAEICMDAMDVLAEIADDAKSKPE